MPTTNFGEIVEFCQKKKRNGNSKKRNIRQNGRKITNGLLIQAIKKPDNESGLNLNAENR